MACGAGSLASGDTRSARTLPGSPESCQLSAPLFSSSNSFTRSLDGACGPGIKRS